MNQERTRKALVVGAGPVGALTALSMHRRGWNVEVWDSRDDPRDKNAAPSNLRSINLAISSRGLEALRSVDPTFVDDFLQEAVPMKGRMIHHTDGKQESQIYDPIRGQCINSISRSILNQKLVQSLPPEIVLKFNTKLDWVDFKTRHAFCSQQQAANVIPGQEENGKTSDSRKLEQGGTAFDLIIGCDGSWSKVRTAMMRADRIDFSQSFISHAYIELHMPADLTCPGGYAMDKNHLHIWPRHSFMLIGLPNKDGSFTLTLFLPFSSLEKIQTRQQALAFFKEHFPSALGIVGEKVLLDDFEKNPRGNLVTINCTPSAWSSHALLLGDSSHSMVPFYGQGLNCGFEDIRVLNSILESHQISSRTTLALGETDPELEKAFQEYSEQRAEDLEAICELARQNYIEMCSKVLSPLHHLRRRVDRILATIFPSPAQPLLSLAESFPTTKIRGWTSLYEMVTFRPDVRYSEALRKENRQKNIMAWAGYVGSLVGFGVFGVATLTLARKWFERR
ncbi:kynurenine 3-monooxygenase [Cryptococcus depauperatus CBS 7841]|uniref:Kynurenine 3-monooxygenase n=1 Tax=Cryptococcus depauperatus CBS 7841 TaxID=1295531 RepID=A0AAJ8LZR4_9TREE